MWIQLAPSIFTGILRKESRSPVLPGKYLESRAVMLFLIVYVVKKKKDKQTKNLDLLNVK